MQVLSQANHFSSAIIRRGPRRASTVLFLGGPQLTASPRASFSYPEIFCRLANDSIGLRQLAFSSTYPRFSHRKMDSEKKQGSKPKRETLLARSRRIIGRHLSDDPAKADDSPDGDQSMQAISYNEQRLKADRSRQCAFRAEERFEEKSSSGQGSEVRLIIHICHALTVLLGHIDEEHRTTFSNWRRKF